MKVCFVVGTLGQGGAERQLMFMLQALLRCGISARVLTLTQGEFFEKDIRGLGISVEFLGESRSPASRLVQLMKELKRAPADVVQSTHFYTNLYAGLCGRILGIPSIGAIRSDFASEVAAHGFWGRWQVATPTFLVANSMSAYSRALSSGVRPNRIGVVRNVVAAQNAEKCGSKSSTPLTILFVGRLDENKRPEKFIRLARVLLRKHRDVPLKFVLAGDGPLLGELKAMSANRGMSADQLTFLGSVADVDSLYRSSHILVSTSRREGTPNVILEAMAHGLPVVSTRVGGIGEILSDRRGILVEPDDDEQLETAVSELIRDSSYRARLGKEGKDYVERDHSIGYLETRLPEIYKRLIEEC